MKTLYLDCGMGAAGDMLAGALLELLPDPDGFVRELNGLGIPGVEMVREPAVKCGITGTHFRVLVHGEEETSEDVHGSHHADDGHAHTHGDEHGQEEEPHVHHHAHEHGSGEDHVHSHPHEEERHEGHSHDHPHDHSHPHEHEHDHHHDPHGHDHDHGEGHHHHHHHHSSMAEITGIVAGLHLPEAVERDVLAVYDRIAQAESQVHGMPVTEIHFHEVGTMDAIADITAVCLLMYRLAPERVVASPVHVGSGQVHCAHGILPVPAPATALILRDVPIYGGEIRGELCTPTGAALLKQFVTEFGAMPVMRTEAIGYGMGKKDFSAANCVRALLGETEGKTDLICELECNVDDMTAEEIGFALERCFEAGVLDAFTIPIGMKKSRPGTLIRVLCPEGEKVAMAETLFRCTTTLGIRTRACERFVLERETKQVETAFGCVRRKDAAGYGVRRSKYEYEDVARIARKKGLSLAEVRRQLPDLSASEGGQA